MSSERITAKAEGDSTTVDSEPTIQSESDHGCSNVQSEATSTKSAETEPQYVSGLRLYILLTAVFSSIFLMALNGSIVATVSEEFARLLLLLSEH